MQLIMNSTQASPANHLTHDAVNHESYFWMKAIHSWKAVIERLLHEAAEIKASPEVTAEVARLAGELSLLADRLLPLTLEIERHLAHDGSGVQHQLLYQKVVAEGDLFRNLLSELFQLEQLAYKPFLS